jgi:hypothetical protein
MKLIAKIVFVAVVGGAGASMYGAPGAIVGNTSSYTAEADAIKSRMLADHEYVMRLRVKAVKEKDVIKLNCLNDKLVQMRPEMNILDSLRQRLDSSTGPEQDAAFNDLVASGNKVREQRELASQCAESTTLIGESSNSFTGPVVPNPADGDNPFGGSEYVEPPVYASPDK